MLTSPHAGAEISSDDRGSVTIYLRLLDADTVGADWREVVQTVFDRDPDDDPEGLRRMHEAHLARAKWLRDGGYLELLTGHAAEPGE